MPVLHGPCLAHGIGRRIDQCLTHVEATLALVRIIRNPAVAIQRAGKHGFQPQHLAQSPSITPHAIATARADRIGVALPFGARKGTLLAETPPLRFGARYVHLVDADLAPTCIEGVVERQLTDGRCTGPLVLEDLFLP